MGAFPTLGQAALAVCGAVCATAPARRHVAAYLTGLMVAERQTGGINREVCLDIIYRSVTTQPLCLRADRQTGVNICDKLVL
jgi:hypothetical protein